MKGHMTKMHSPRSEIVSASPEEKHAFTQNAVFAIQEVLAATPKRNLANTGAGSHITTVSVDCSRKVFISLFNKERGFWFPKNRKKNKRNNTSLRVTFSGIAGMRKLEAIFGKGFFKYTFPGGQQVYASFYDRTWKANQKMTLSFKTKVISNSNPIGTFVKERVSISFIRKRVEESLLEFLSTEAHEFPKLN